MLQFKVCVATITGRLCTSFHQNFLRDRTQEVTPPQGLYCLWFQPHDMSLARRHSVSQHLLKLRSSPEGHLNLWEAPESSQDTGETGSLPSVFVVLEHRNLLEARLASNSPCGQG